MAVSLPTVHFWYRAFGQVALGSRLGIVKLYYLCNSVRTIDHLMSTTADLILALKHELKSAHITYAYLARKLGKAGILEMQIQTQDN